MTFHYYVYILRCSEGHFYVGCTNNLSDRLERHARGQVSYTKDKLPVNCVAATGFVDKYKAFAFEKYLKSGSGRAFMGRHLI